MTLIGLFVLLIVAGFIAYLAVTHLPPPFGWIVVAVVLVVLLVVLLNLAHVGGQLGFVTSPWNRS